MSWFGSSTSALQLELDNKIGDATSESIPNGELDLSTALEVTDFIRSKKLPAQQSMRSLKKRLNLVYSNPNLLTSTLKLVDLCVKNSGFHFLVEISSREFMDYLVDFVFKVHYNTKDHNYDEHKVGELILSLIKQWVNFFQGQLQLNYVEKKYQELVKEGYSFPTADESVGGGASDSKFIDSEVPPDWIDSDSCMICYTPFSMLNRKHHCRACGGVYCQDHSSNNMKLVNLGIMEPVRVCDNCYAKRNKKTSKPHAERRSGHEDEDEELRKAIELSLKESSVGKVTSSSNNTSNSRYVDSIPQRESQNTETGNDEDEELKKAIQLSLQEYESQKPQNNESMENNSSISHNIEESDPYNIPFKTKTSKSKAQMNSNSSRPSSISNSSQSQAQSPIDELKRTEEGLRQANEKYATFLEMSNKINTITRLYEQYWEKKLRLGQPQEYQQPHQQSYQQSHQQSYQHPYQQSYQQPHQQPHQQSHQQPHQQQGYNQEELSPQPNQSQIHNQAASSPSFEQEQQLEEQPITSEMSGNSTGNMVSLPHYPPLDDNSNLSNELPTQSFIRHASSTLPPHAYEDASAKFPSLEAVEEKNKHEEALIEL
ncbi:Vacuolar protein-sorting-associated protein 27 [Lodderomyces elongisporus]|uniref:Vacuolar protein-sorting-associated protein 27 n=1 Tax=Lodderomyces elongisporus TaxID=36914 RepID=UPI002926E8DC|nr:Vacuolar protein-sorting-associated protein 27 [Lodderomyces elongisporus]WLF77604.1 Vacuolar protein-sorting-associated protein 27 [Lodderomyces elongisporus]